MRPAACVCLALAMSACGPAPQHLGWTVAFESPALETESAHVSAFILRGGCAGTERVYETSVGSAPTQNESAPLSPGRYGFAAQASTSACAPVAYGCVEREVPLKEGASIDIVLAEARSAAKCAPDLCNAGVCGVPSDASVVSDAASMTDDCAEGTRRPGGHCYRYYDLTTDFSDARELCGLWSSDVTVLDDAAEETWVTQTFAPVGDYWLGLTDETTEGTWRTVSGAAPSYVHFDPDDSASSNANNCVRYFLMNGMWRDNPCSDEFRVVCERP